MARRRRPLRFVTYIRLSAEPTEGRSVQAQAERVRAYAASIGWQVLPVYESTERDPR